MKIKVGIFFGGPSRERESSFAAGRMIYDHLDRAIFEPTPIWVTSRLEFVLLDWSFLYKDNLRHFFPPLEALPSSPNAFEVYGESLGDLSEEEWSGYLHQVGRKVVASDLPQWISMAFLTIPGRFGGDGQLQQILTEQQIPFTGSSAGTCRSLYSKTAQKAKLSEENIPTPRWVTFLRDDWTGGDPATFYEAAATEAGFPMIVRPAHQELPTGAANVDSEAGVEAFEESVNGAFFRERIPVSRWRKAAAYDRLDHLRLLADPKDGLGFPIDVTSAGERVTLHHPEQLLKYLEERSALEEDPEAAFLLESRYGESEVLLEARVDGLPFSCMVICPEDGRATALLPSERPYETDLLDPSHGGGSSKRAASLSLLPASQVDELRRQCEAAFEHLGLQVFGRIDGYITTDGRVLISEAAAVPEWGSDALIFRQMALLGLTASQSLTFLLRSSLEERCREWPEAAALTTLCELLDDQLSRRVPRRKVAVLMGGDTAQETLPLAYGRRIVEQLSASETYEPLPFFLSGHTPRDPLYQLPLHDLFFDHRRALEEELSRETWSITGVEALRSALATLIDKYASAGRVYEPHQIPLEDLSEWVDCAWIAARGRPASAGALQEELERMNLPFNGARRAALRAAHNRYHRLEILNKNGMAVPDQYLLGKNDFLADPETFLDEVESKLGYPLTAMPADELHPVASRTIDDRSQLQAYCRLLFREEGHTGIENRYLLKLRPQDAFPRKEKAHFQAQLRSGGAGQFLKIQGTVLTQLDQDQNIQYELFTPSEIIDDHHVLTQEERYLLGAGSCITPARFAVGADQLRQVKRQVKQSLEKAVRILLLEGIVSVKSSTRLWENGRVETIIRDIQPLPALLQDRCLLRQAVYQGYTPLQLIEQQLQYGEARFRQPETAEPAAPLDAAEPPKVPAESLPEETPPVYQEDAVAAGIRSSDNASLSGQLKNFFAAIWAFLKSPFFLKNFAALLGFLLLLFLLLNFLLNRYTHHGESLQVHDYVDMKIDEAIDKARSRSFRIVISDSVFLVDREPNIVLEQSPPAFSRVKENRRIYVTITGRTAPKVLLPTLEGSYNFNSYRRKLLRLGLKATIRDRQFNNKLEENTILYFYFDGERITEEQLQQGVKVPKGSTLEFVVTERLSREVTVPDLTCMRYEEASWVITNYELVVGEIIGSVGDRNNAYVYRQDPEPGQILQKGGQVNIYLSSRRPANCGGQPEEEDTPEGEFQDDFQEERE